MTDQKPSEAEAKTESMIAASGIAPRSDEESGRLEETVRMLAAVRLLLRQLRERMR